MKYLLDTNVVSALRVRGRNPDVERWASSILLADHYVAAVSIAEIERGVAAKEREDPSQGVVLRRWFEESVLPAFAGRVLAFDLAAARILTGYRVPERAPYDDALIAATAQAAGAAVATATPRSSTRSASRRSTRGRSAADSASVNSASVCRSSGRPASSMVLAPRSPAEHGLVPVLGAGKGHKPMVGGGGGGGPHARRRHHPGGPSGRSPRAERRSACAAAHADGPCVGEDRPSRAQTLSETAGDRAGRAPHTASARRVRRS